MTYVNELIRESVRVPQPEGRADFIRLDQNENPDGLPQWFFDKTIKKVTPQMLAMYPEEQVLTKKYAAMVGLDEACVTLTNGSATGMESIFKVFGESGKKFVTVTPTFGLYNLCGQMNGMIPVQLEYEPDYTFKFEKFLDAIDKDTGLIVMVNPNMPMGNIYTQEQIESVIRKAKENDAMVIVDEAYHYFYDGTSVDLIKKYDNLIVLRTFSKMLAITSLRIGVVMSDEKNIAVINNLIPHYTINSVGLLFGEAIVDDIDKLLPELKGVFEEGKAYITKALEENGYFTVPGHGCFMCIRPKYKTSACVTEELKKRGILILNGKGYLDGLLRLTICNVKYMKIFMEALLDIDRE